jgi:thiamine-phosphate pyrophosphorylase
LSGPASQDGPLGRRRLYLCTPGRPDLSWFVEACIDGGVDVVQLRDKRLEARALVERASELRDLCRERDVPFILNDRPDLALEVGADGVHLGQEDASPRLARRILGPGAVVGWSTHSREELDRSISERVDYVSAGPVVPTPTKPGRPGTGPALVSYAVEHAGRPVYVTGGVSPESVLGLVRVGARRFVVVRHLTEARDPRGAARRLCAAIDEAISECESASGQSG